MLRRLILLLLLLTLVTTLWLVSRQYSLSPSEAKLRQLDSVFFPEAETGQVAVKEVLFHNDGNAPLHIHSIRSSCSCLGLEESSSNGHFRKLQEFYVAPGDSKHVFVRLVVNGVPGSKLGGVVYFVTNDPRQPEVKLPIQVDHLSAGARAIPNVVTFEESNQGSYPDRIVDIIDYSANPRAISRMAGGSDSGITAKLLDLEGQEKKVNGGTLIGRLQLTLSTLTPRSIDTRVSVWLDSETPKSPVSIHVIATIPPSFEVLPTQLQLPLHTENGPIFKATLLCRAASPIQSLKITKITGGFEGEVLTSTNPHIPQRISIYHPSTHSIPANSEVVVSATFEGKEYTQTVQILCNSGAGK